MGDLTDLEKQILDFEAKWWRDPSGKAAVIPAEFRLAVPRYYELLNEIVDKPEALAYAPVTSRRVIRLRTQRQSTRQAQEVLAHDKRAG